MGVGTTADAPADGAHDGPVRPAVGCHPACGADGAGGGVEVAAEVPYRDDVTGAAEGAPASPAAGRAEPAPGCPPHALDRGWNPLGAEGVCAAAGGWAVGLTWAGLATDVGPDEYGLDGWAAVEGRTIEGRATAGRPTAGRATVGLSAGDGSAGDEAAGGSVGTWLGRPPAASAGRAGPAGGRGAAGRLV